MPDRETCFTRWPLTDTLDTAGPSWLCKPRCTVENTDARRTGVDTAGRVSSRAGNERDPDASLIGSAD